MLEEKEIEIELVIESSYIGLKPGYPRVIYFPTWEIKFDFELRYLDSEWES